MATRMQQRRGTASQWTAANPTLAAGEIGFETDNNRFKIGDGATAWTALDYFANSAALSALLDGAPDALNTLNELAAAIGDDADFFSTVATNLSNHESDTTNVHGIADTTALATTADTATAISTAVVAHDAETTNVHGIADTTALATTADTATAIATAVTTHNDEITNVHGIADTSLLATTEYVDNALSTSAGEYPSLAGSGLAWNVTTESLDVDETIATVSSLTDHASETANVHGIADTSLLATTSDVDAAQTAAETTASGYVITHNSATTNVHGIADTSLLATKAYADSASDTAEADAITAAGTAADAKIATAVGLLDKTSVGLGNVENTSDANKPVSDATQTALNLKAPLADPTFSGTVTAGGDLVVDGDFTVNGTNFNASATSITIEDNLLQLAHLNAANTVDLGLVVAYNDGTAKHSGIVRDVSESKWKLFSGVTTEPTTVVAFGEGSLDALAVGALEATTITPSSGIVFSDGTQTKEGVPSQTAISQKTASYTLSSLTERDTMIEIGAAGAVTLTIPTNASVAYPIGTTIDILQTSTGQVTIAPVNGTVTVNATPGLKLRTTWSSATLMKRAANTWVVYGDLTA